MQTNYVSIAVNTPFNSSILTYKEGGEELYVGQLVSVPLGKRTVNGCVIKINLEDTELPKNLNKDDLREVKSILTEDLFLPTSLLGLYKWVADYYHYNLGQYIFDSLPKILKRPRDLNFVDGRRLDKKFVFTEKQSEYISVLNKSLDQGFSKWLLHGVTGSGKTEIYLQVIQKILAAGKSALFLLPEINLTPQFLKTFGEGVDGKIYSYNSSLSASDRFGLWKNLLSDSRPKVIIGVRSSINLPIQNLGVIIIDEEHDQSFKQEDRCTYNARDMAIKRASLEKVPVIMGSATPSLETYATHIGGESYLPMEKRVGKAKLPEVEMVDLRCPQVKNEVEPIWPLTKQSLNKITLALAKGEQVLCFVNRLGYASFLQCRACAFQFNCPNCSTNLKYFKRKNEIHCHYCDYKDSLPEQCPECGNLKLLQKGFGTEKIQAVLKEQFPQKKIERFDRDDIKTMNQLEQRLNSFQNGEIDIMVGTQMLSKGHNFEKVNLVLIFGTDSQLNFPDFRSNERVYQLLTQVSGRSGRYGKESSVLIHSVGVENKIFDYVKKHSFDDFYKDELKLRELCDCPPFKKMISIYVTSKNQHKTMEAAENVVDQLNIINERHFGNVEVIGPRPAMIEKRVNKFTWSLLLRSSDVNQMHNLLRTFKASSKQHYSITLKIDVDPIQIH